MNILDGAKLYDRILENVSKTVKKLKTEKKKPHLAIILVGEKEASLSYIKQKRKACIKTGIECSLFKFKENISTDTILRKIKILNKNPKVHGILVQLPLPKQIDFKKIIKAIDPKKDVDGFHPVNLGKVMLGPSFEYLVPCTPAGIIEMLEYYKIPISGQNITVVGHSNIVGKPMSMMLLNRNATVTTCHIYTKNLKEKCLSADILISAVGKPGLIKADMVKKGVIAIDVGCTKIKNKLYGDFDFANVSKKAKLITPVPGGVGPMTVAKLMENVVIATK